MIKLFWNTHNQNINSTYKQSNKKDKVDHKWGLYHKENSNGWINNILKKIQFKTIKNEKEIDEGEILIIVDSSVEKKIQLYERLKLICSKIFLIHLGDEFGIYDMSTIYNKFNFVWRGFCLNKYFRNEKVNCLPIGYKSGVFFSKQAEERKYKWSFVGTPHKSSRHDLLFQFSSIKPSFCHKTKKFNEKIIEVNEMSKILSSTIFIPCPNGFVHPETYRLYEALECGCIPIVENAYKYYDLLFPNNPFLKVDKWIEAKSVIKEWKDSQIKQKQEECLTWWSKYKDQLQDFVKNKIYS